MRTDLGAASRPSIVAVIPAAGRSRRMGQAKLLLPWGETTVIGQILDTLAASDVDRTYILVRPDDEPLREEAARHTVVVVQPAQAPADMRESVQHLLAAVRDHERPGEADGWLLVPGDHPLINPATLRLLLQTWRESPHSIVVPGFQGRRGHPTAFPWGLAAEVARLPDDVGINELLARHPERIRVLDVPDPSIVCDLNTPDDYRRARETWGDGRPGE